MSLQHKGFSGKRTIRSKRGNLPLSHLLSSLAKLNLTLLLDLTMYLISRWCKAVVRQNNIPRLTVSSRMIPRALKWALSTLLDFKISLVASTKTPFSMRYEIIYATDESVFFFTSGWTWPEGLVRIFSVGGRITGF